MRLHAVRAIGILVAALIAGPAFADILTGKVVGVSDGDTVTVLIEEHVQVKVRIAGIDAPEMSQAFGQAAKSSMSDCAYGKQAQVEWKKLDRYGRTVGKLTVGGLDCGLRQINMGLAWHYKAHAREQWAEDRRTYAEAETVARASSKGLWVDSNPIPPWDYRHPGHREAAP